MKPFLHYVAYSFPGICKSPSWGLLKPPFCWAFSPAACYFTSSSHIISRNDPILLSSSARPYNLLGFHISAPHSVKYLRKEIWGNVGFPVCVSFSHVLKSYASYFPIPTNIYAWASLIAQQVKNPPVIQETQETRVRSLGWEDPLEEEMANKSRSLAWKIQWIEEPAGLQSTRLQKVRLDWPCKLVFS